MLRSSNRFVLLAAAWASIIFVTSCRFIDRAAFINFIGQFIPAGVLKQGWASLWEAVGIFIVKGYHVTEYAVLCYLLFLALSIRLDRRSGQAVMAAAVISALYAASDEWHQTFVPGRGGTWIDVVIDCCGIAIAVFLINRRRLQPSWVRDDTL